eukprot:3096611-Amphidinium_carterae.1
METRLREKRCLIRRQVVDWRIWVYATNFTAFALVYTPGLSFNELATLVLQLSGLQGWGYRSKADVCGSQTSLLRRAWVCESLSSDTQLQCDST